MDGFPHHPGSAARYFPPRWKLLFLVLTCAVVGVVALVPALTAGPVMAGVGWVLVVLLALAGLVLLIRALRPGPSVVIDRDGITDRTTIAPLGLVRWEEITVVRKREIGRGMGAERLLEVVLADPEEFHSRRGWPQRAVRRYRAFLRQPAVSIPGSMVSVPMQAVMDEIRQRRPGLQVLEGPPPAPSKLQLLRRRRPEAGRRHPDLPRW